MSVPVSDGSAWMDLAILESFSKAFVAINFYPTEIDQLQSAVAAVLMIGQIDFVDSSDGDAAMIENSFMLENVCHVLAVTLDSARPEHASFASTEDGLLTRHFRDQPNVEIIGENSGDNDAGARSHH